MFTLIEVTRCNQASNHHKFSKIIFFTNHLSSVCNHHFSYTEQNKYFNRSVYVLSSMIIDVLLLCELRVNMVNGELPNALHPFRFVVIGHTWWPKSRALLFTEAKFRACVWTKVYYKGGSLEYIPGVSTKSVLQHFG